MNRWWLRLKRVLRFQYLRVSRQQSSAHSLALGMACGVAAGFLPIPGQIPLAVALAFVLRCSKLTAALGTFVSNPIVFVPLTTTIFFVGRLVLPFEIEFDPRMFTLDVLLEKGWRLFLVLTVGGVILGIPAAVAAYAITLWGVLAYRRRRSLAMLRRRIGM